MQTLRLLYKSQKSFTQLIEGSSLDLAGKDTQCSSDTGSRFDRI